MKTRHIHLPALLLTLLAASVAAAARDPFWPIGYVPPPPKAAEEPVAAAPEPQQPKPVENAVTEAEWALARKALVISGFTQTVRPGTQEIRNLAMVNRRMVAAGDTVTLVHQNIRFLWNAETVTDRAIQLVPVKAERISPKSADLKPESQPQPNKSQLN
jgi:hypothetical protein